MAEPKKFSELGIKLKPTKMPGQRGHLRHVLEKEILVCDFRIKPSKFPQKSEQCLWIQYKIDDKLFVAFSIAQFLMIQLKELPEGWEPFITTITNKNEIYEFV
ncbi:MAG: hypothetical protein V4547_17695 [Bacteroidota bacterium]